MSSWVSTPLADRLLFRDFEDGSVGFDPATTATLLLSPLSSFLLGLWRQPCCRPLTFDDLLTQVLAVDDSSADLPEARRMLEDALDELQRSGLLAASAAA